MKRFLAYIISAVAIVGSTVVVSASAPQQGSGVEIVAESVATVTPGVGELTLSVPSDQPQRFHIFSITGKMVKSVEVASGEQRTVELPNGCYIVKCSQWSKKVVVR